MRSLLSSFSLPVGLYQFARNSAFRYLTDLVELYRRVSSQMQSCCNYSCDLTLQSSVLSDFESRRKRRFVFMSVQAETERFRSVENESLLLEGRRTGCGDRAVHGATGRKCLGRYELMSVDLKASIKQADGEMNAKARKSLLRLRSSLRVGTPKWSSMPWADVRLLHEPGASGWCWFVFIPICRRLSSQS